MRRLADLRLMMIGLVMVMLLAPPSTALAQGGTVTHVVSPGENLYRISLRYGVSIQALVRANRLANANAVYAGQRLTVPTASSSGSSAVPVVLPPNVPGDPSVQEGATTHSVAPGENLYRIGLRYGVNVQALAWANGLNNTHLIYVGQKLVIPNRPDASASPTPAPQPETSRSDDQSPSARDGDHADGHTCIDRDGGVTGRASGPGPVEQHRQRDCGRAARAKSLRLRERPARSQLAGFHRHRPLSHAGGPVSHLHQVHFYFDEGARLLFAQCAVHDVFLRQLWIARHVLAQKLWTPHESRLCELADRRSEMVL